MEKVENLKKQISALEKKNYLLKLEKEQLRKDIHALQEIVGVFKATLIMEVEKRSVERYRYLTKKD